jgi:intracellular septation protein A
MDWHYWAALVAGLVLASLADWLFAGVLFHEKYQAYPEVWRVNGTNPKALMMAQALTIPTVVGLVTLMQITGRLELMPALVLAALVWVIAAAPAILANGIYIKLHPAIIVTHTIGWLVKLALIAAVASYLLRL